ncbi:MAG: HAAS signaling domain-containing protein [Pseudomonadota bacterium]
MSDATKIEDYLRALSRALRTLPDRDRDDIVAEIRAHLEHRSSEGKLADAMKALGPADACARSFIEEMKIQSAFADGGPAKTFGALIALASRRATAALGLFFTGIFFVIAAAFAFIAFYEMVSPEQVGLWSDPATGSFFFGTIDQPASPTARELLGRWLIPVAAALAVLSFVFAQTLARFFIRLMMRRPHPIPI